MALAEKAPGSKQEAEIHRERRDQHLPLPQLLTSHKNLELVKALIPDIKWAMSRAFLQDRCTCC